MSEQFGIGNKDIKTNNIESFKGEKGKTYVISIAWDTLESCFKGSKYHYSERLKKGWRCLSTESNNAICCTHSYDGNEPTQRIAAPIVIYKTDENNIVTGISKVSPWRFGASMYKKMERIFIKYGHVDLSLTCTDDKYQNFDIMPEPGCVWKKDEKVSNFVMAKAREIMEKDIEKMLGKKMTEVEIREYLGLNTNAGDTNGGMDFSSLAENIPGA